MTIVDNILNEYKKSESIKATAQNTGCSWNRVVKVLSSNGILINNTHRRILELHEEGFPTKEIAKKLGMNEKTIKSYLPRQRPYYGVDMSENAKRIKKCREKTKLF